MSFGLWVLLIYSFISLAWDGFQGMVYMTMKEDKTERVGWFIRFANSILIILCIVLLMLE